MTYKYNIIGILKYNYTKQIHISIYVIHLYVYYEVVQNLRIVSLL